MQHRGKGLEVNDAEQRQRVAENSRFRAHEDLSWRDIKGDLVVLNLKSAQYTTFNGVGRAIWISLTDGKTVGQVADDIAGQYDARRNVILADVCQFTSRLFYAGLLTSVGA